LTRWSFRGVESLPKGGMPLKKGNLERVNGR
jgi:hypothetical protein